MLPLSSPCWTVNGITKFSGWNMDFVSSLGTTGWSVAWHNIRKTINKPQCFKQCAVLFPPLQHWIFLTISFKLISVVMSLVSVSVALSIMALSCQWYTLLFSNITHHDLKRAFRNVLPSKANCDDIFSRIGCSIIYVEGAIWIFCNIHIQLHAIRGQNRTCHLPFSSSFGIHSDKCLVCKLNIGPKTFCSNKNIVKTKELNLGNVLLGVMVEHL